MKLGKQIKCPFKDVVMSPIHTLVSNYVNDNVWNKAREIVMFSLKDIILRTICRPIQNTKFNGIR